MIIVAALVVQQCSCVPVEDGNDGTTGHHHEVISENITEPTTAVNANGNGTTAVNDTTVADEQQFDSKNRVVCRPVNPIVSVEGDNHEYHYVRIDWNQTVREHYVVHVAVDRSAYDGYGAPAADVGEAFGTDARHLVCRIVNETEPAPAVEQQPARIYMVNMINVTAPMNGSRIAGDFHVRVINRSGYTVYADGQNVTASLEHRISCHFDGPMPHHNGGQILCIASPTAEPSSTTNSTADSDEPSTIVMTETTPTGTTPTEKTTTVMLPTEKTTTVVVPTKDNKAPPVNGPRSAFNSTDGPKEGNVICRMASQIEIPTSDHTHYIVHLANSTGTNPNKSRTGASRSLENHVYCRVTDRSDLNAADYKLYQVYLLKNNSDVNYGSYNRNATIDDILSWL